MATLTAAARPQGLRNNRDVYGVIPGFVDRKQPVSTNKHDTSNDDERDTMSWDEFNRRLGEALGGEWKVALTDEEIDALPD